MIDVYLFTGFQRGDAASFGPIITKRLEKRDETIEVTFPMLDILRRTLEAGPIGSEPISRPGRASR